MKTMTVTRRRRLDRVRKAAGRFVQAVEALRDGDMEGVPVVRRQIIGVAAYAAMKVDAGLTLLLGDESAPRGDA